MFGQILPAFCPPYFTPSSYCNPNMSSAYHNTRTPSAGRERRRSPGEAQDQTYDTAKTHQDMPSSAHEYHQQRRKEPQAGDQNDRYVSLGTFPLCLGPGLTLACRQSQAASTLTSQALTRFEEQPHNNLQALDERVTEYRKSSPSPGENKKSAKDHQRQMADSMKAWSDGWKRLERK